MKITIPILTVAALLPTLASAAEYAAPKLQAESSMRAWLLIALFLVGALVPLLKSFRLDGGR